MPEILPSPPQLSPYLFWDTDRTRLDWQGNAAFVIRRAFERGTLDDLLEVLVYYGREKVIAVLTSAEDLSEMVVALASVVFSLKPEEFRWNNPTPNP